MRCRTPDAVIAALARRQEGYVATRQLLARGLTGRQVEGRAERKLLTPGPHRGVWSLGPRRTTASARWWAAVLACGPASAVGLRSAGLAWQVVRSEGGKVSVLAPHGARPRTDLLVIPTRTLVTADVVELDGLRVTSLARTLVDLARVLDHGQLVAALNAAEARHQNDVREIRRVLARTRPVAVRDAVERALAEIAAHGLTLSDSELEDVLRDLCRSHDLPLPQTQVVVAGHRTDAWWPGPRLALEADGYATHRDLKRFRADRALDRRRSALGVTTLRFTHAELVHDGPASAREIAAALARLGGA